VSDPGQGRKPDPGTEAPKRKPYAQPAVSWEEPLEARPGLMAGCLKLPTQGDPCDTTAQS